MTLASNLDSATLSAMASAIRTSSYMHVVGATHYFMLFHPCYIAMDTGSDTNQNIKDVIVTNSVPLKDFHVIKQGKTCLKSNAREPDISECQKYASETDGLNFEAAPIGLADSSGCIILGKKVHFQANDEPNQKCFNKAKCVCVSGECVLMCACLRMTTRAYHN